MGTPIGAIYSTNITPDAADGIGRFTFADFDKALRYGVADGHTLYPAMPFTSYYNTKPEDVQALYAYFNYAVEPARVPNRASDIPFPLSMRWPLTYWRWLEACPFQSAGRLRYRSGARRIFRGWARALWGVPHTAQRVHAADGR
jgi:hypothetical protein